MREIRQAGPYQYVFSRYVEPIARVEAGETVAIYTEDAFESRITRLDDRPSEMCMEGDRGTTDPLSLLDTRHAWAGDALVTTAILSLLSLAYDVI